MSEIEVAGRRQAVALLGHRHGDHPGADVRKPLQGGARRVGCSEQLLDDADDAQTRLGVQLDQRVQAVLRGEGLAHAVAAKRDLADAAARILGQQSVEHRRLVGAMEGARAQMRDAHRRSRRGRRRRATPHGEFARGSDR